MVSRCLISLFALLFLASHPLGEETKTPQLLSRDEVVAKATAAVATLDQRYWSPTLSIWLDRTGDDLRGHYEHRVNPPWWSAANAVESLIDLMNLTGSNQAQANLESLYEINRDFKNRLPRLVAELKRRGQWSAADELKLAAAATQTPPTKTGIPATAASPAQDHTDFRNEYLDDSAWWGLAWLKMYDRTKGAKYLETARGIQRHLARHWRPDQDGGIMWCEDPDKLRPNAITNSLFIILSARLYQRTHEAGYREWAEKTLAWFQVKALYDGTAVVDALGHQGDYWTYNQGCYLGALTALFEATSDSSYLDQAAHAAETIIQHSGDVLPSGVLFEKLGTNGWDPGLFKGIFARYLGQLRDVLLAHQQHLALAQKIDQILESSASSLLAKGPDADGQYSIAWEAGSPDQTRNFNTQAAALALLVATLHPR